MFILKQQSNVNRIVTITDYERSTKTYFSLFKRAKSSKTLYTSFAVITLLKHFKTTVAIEAFLNTL